MTPSERFKKLKAKYHYDEAEAERRIGFIEAHLTHVEGDLAGQPLIFPDEYKNDILRPMYGLKKEDGKRLINEVFIQMPRKNSKSTMCSAMQNIALFTDGEAAAQIYNCAGDDEQAGLLFRLTKMMVANSPKLRKASKTFQSSITYKDSFIKKITSKSDTKHGFNTHCAIYDELHVAPNRDLYDTLRTSTGQRSNPLLIEITTPGHDKTTLCYIQYDYTKRILKGQIEDDSFWGVIYESDPEWDIYDPKTWEFANPLYKYSANLRNYITKEAVKAKNDPAYENTFRRLNLGQWTSSETRWLKTELWTSLENKDLKIEDFYGKPCWLGVDRSSTQDISSLCVLFEEGDTLIPFWFLWVSSASAKNAEEKYNVPYKFWEENNLIQIVEGTHVGPYGIRDKIIEISEKHSIVIMGYDEWNTVDMAVELQDQLDIETVIEKQGYGLSVGIKKIEEKVKAAQFLHSGNQAVTWCLENVMIKQDDELREKFVKPKDYKKIDPWVSLAMAVRNWIEVRPKVSVYSTRGVISI